MLLDVNLESFRHVEEGSGEEGALVLLSPGSSQGQGLFRHPSTLAGGGAGGKGPRKQFGGPRALQHPRSVKGREVQERSWRDLQDQRLGVALQNQLCAPVVLLGGHPHQVQHHRGRGAG